MSAGTATFDASKFERLYRYSTSVPKTGYDNAPERGNARDAAERVAAKAGLTFEEAVSRIKERPSENFGNSRAWEDFKAERWKAHVREHERKQKEAQERAEQEERERQREQEAREAKARMEAIKREQVAAIWRKACPESTVELALVRAARELGLDPYAKLYRTDSTIIEAAARNAFRFPSTFAEAIAEVDALNTAREMRRRKVPKYDHGGLVTARNDLLLNFLTGSASTPEDASARAAWIMEMPGSAPGTDPYDWMNILAGDIVRLKASLDTAKDKLAAERRKHDHHTARPAKPVKRTSAQKRKAVADILNQPGSDRLTLREIAERAGVHHSTVAEIRRERQGHA
ncbi:hypothetical protein [Methylorubrum thiocyanatum]|uniref:hypothetical protein n=1 Tax=Methylorubrum thiocyanatum TaxID=47958 RepID=UPI003F802187